MDVWKSIFRIFFCSLAIALTGQTVTDRFIHERVWDGLSGRRGIEIIRPEGANKGKWALSLRRAFFYSHDTHRKLKKPRASLSSTITTQSEPASQCQQHTHSHMWIEFKQTPDITRRVHVREWMDKQKRSTSKLCDGIMVAGRTSGGKISSKKREREISSHVIYQLAIMKDNKCPIHIHVNICFINFVRSLTLVRRILCCCCCVVDDTRLMRASEAARSYPAAERGNSCFNEG